MTDSVQNRKSFFHTHGFTNAINGAIAEIQELYLSDDTPWVIGYSGGKDSTAVTQLVWLALNKLANAEIPRKPVYVITTDTQVENPIVAAWVRNSLETMDRCAKADNLPIQVKLLEPAIEDSFWVNLIGKGYPAPRQGFRWCTERLKIKPASQFIEQTANRYGEAILLLGARKAESAARSASLSKRERLTKEGLTAHNELVSTLVYAPIQDWSDDDVWMFLTRIPNPWGHSNKDLLALYRGATEDNECPIVVDTSAPSCGNSRFGCWVCTLVDQDKSMKAMIQNDTDKSWMRPLLEFRNELDFRGEEERKREHERREFRRLRGAPSLNRTADDLVPGPYTQAARATWLRRLLEVQSEIRQNPETPDALKSIQLISRKELEAIRHLWVEKKHEIEDLVPKIYQQVEGKPYSDVVEEPPAMDDDSLRILADVAGGDQLHYETIRNLIDVESRFRKGGVSIARRGLFKELQSVIESGYFRDRADALAWAQSRSKSHLNAAIDTVDHRLFGEIPEIPLMEADYLEAETSETGASNAV